DAEDRGVRADAERQRDDRDDREAGLAPEGPQRVFHVFDERVHSGFLVPRSTFAFHVRGSTPGSTFPAVRMFVRRGVLPRRWPRYKLCPSAIPGGSLMTVRNSGVRLG